MPTLPVVGQIVGALAVLIGLFLLLPFGIALTTAGAVVLLGSVLLEAVMTRPKVKRRDSGAPTVIGKAA